MRPEQNTIYDLCPFVLIQRDDKLPPQITGHRLLSSTRVFIGSSSIYCTFLAKPVNPFLSTSFTALISPYQPGRALGAPCLEPTSSLSSSYFYFHLCVVLSLICELAVFCSFL